MVLASDAVGTGGKSFFSAAVLACGCDTIGPLGGSTDKCVSCIGTILPLPALLFVLTAVLCGGTRTCALACTCANCGLST